MFQVAQGTVFSLLYLAPQFCASRFHQYKEASWLRIYTI